MDIITRAEAQAQGLKRYFTGKPCKHGHIAQRYTGNKKCVGCDNAGQARLRQEHPELVAERKKRSYEANKEQVLAQQKKYHERNRTQRLQTMAAYREANRQTLRDKQRAYQEANKAAMPTRKKASYQKHRTQILLRQATAIKTRCATDHGYRLLLSHRKRLSRFLCQGDSRRVASCRELTGVGTTQLAKHIESQFTSGMTWASYGRDGWHLDHIRPCMSFDQTCQEQQAVCWNWRNLQPLWAADNIAKNDKWTPTMEAEWVQRMTDLGWEGDLFLAFEQAVAA